MKSIIIATSLCFLTFGCGDSDNQSQEMQAAQQVMLEQITVEGVRYHVEVLGDDALEGREAGTRGFNAAGDYVANEYKNMGLKTFAGLEGADGYFQPVPFLVSSLKVDSAAVSFNNDGVDTDLTIKEDFVMGAGFSAAEESISAPLVFVGFGIVSPENDMDSYAGVDTTGKIVVMISGAPASFGPDERAYYARTKAQTAEDNGAIGVITIRSLTDQNRRDFSFYFPGLGRSGMRWVNAEGEAQDAHTQLEVTATLSQPGAEKLFDGIDASLDDILAAAEEGESQSFAMGKTATLSRSSNHSQAASHNVVGYIEGSDPELKNEYVVYGAHLDHIGIRPGKNGDDIHNGVFDNATGVASILEIASVMSKSAIAPRRSVIFVSYTGEEKGLRGSSYFVNNPPVDVDQLVANVNLDMPILTFAADDVIPLGAEHSTLLSAAEKATETLGITLTPDPSPEEGSFMRSDHFSFIKAGIPAIAYKAGIHSSDPRVDGMEMVLNFRKNHYHQSSDDLKLPFDKIGVENYVRGALLIGWNIANDDARPTWIEGDFFGEKFGK